MLLPVRVLLAVLISVAPVKLALVARCHLTTLPTKPVRLMLAGVAPEQILWLAEIPADAGLDVPTVAEPFMVAEQGPEAVVATTV
jgi:hypothetical protein